jgi:hypothetical protein
MPKEDLQYLCSSLCTTQVAASAIALLTPLYGVIIGCKGI